MEDTYQQLTESATKLAGSVLWSLSDTDLLTRLDLVHHVEQTLAAVKAHLIREVDSRDLPTADNARSTGTWLGCRWRVRIGTGRQQVELAKGLDRRPALDQALIAGVVNTEQAIAIWDCVNTLPTEIGVDAIDEAERLLIGWAAQFDASGLRKLADRILAYVAPEIAEELEAAALAKAEADAHEARSFTLSSPVNGRVRVRGSLDVEAAAIVEGALDPLCSPRTSLSDDGVAGGMVEDRVTRDDRRPEQRRADALVEVCQLALRTGELPVNGGEAAQMNVTVSYETLVDDLASEPPDFLTTLVTGPAPDGTGPAPDGSGPAPDGSVVSDNDTGNITTPSNRRHRRRQLGIGALGNGHRISPTTVRRLACDARLLPAVLGTDGQVLDVGRTKRLIDRALRQALVLRDRGCAFPGCTRPARWSEGHHIVSWADGGVTSLDNAVLLCRPHHRTIHHTDWTVRLGPDGLPDFIPPVYVDLDQRPRRNAYHPRQ